MSSKKIVTKNEIKWTRRFNWLVGAILAVGIAFIISIQIKMLKKGGGIDGAVVYSIFLLVTAGAIIFRHNRKFLKDNE